MKKGTECPVMSIYGFTHAVQFFFFNLLQFVHTIGKSFIVPPLKSVLVKDKEEKKNPHAVQKISQSTIDLQQLLHDLVSYS